jgi:hypothetical protein
LWRGAWDKSDAATFFWRFDEVGLRKIREAFDAAFFPVAMIISFLFHAPDTP